jgi:putative copper resistance protein D
MIYVVLEWLQLICLAFCIGVIVCRLWFFSPSMQAEFSYQGDIVPGMWKLFCFALAFMIAGSVAALVLRSMEMSGQPLSEIASVLPLVLFKTHYGTVWLVRIGALVLLALSKTAVRYRDTRTFLIFMLVLALVVSLTSSASGHGADAGDFSLPEIMDWLHLIAACLWGGGLLVLTLSILPGLIEREEAPAALISRVAGRFSAMAGIAVAMVLITAVYNFWADVRSVAAMMQSIYGLVVATKIVLFGILVNFGAFNRYVSVPLLQEWGGGSAEIKGVIDHIAGKFYAPFRHNRDGRMVASRFKRLVRLETVLILAVLFCAGLLRHEIPARHAAMMQHQMGQPMQHNMETNMGHPSGRNN